MNDCEIYMQLTNNKPIEKKFKKQNGEFGIHKVAPKEWQAEVYYNVVCDGEQRATIKAEQLVIEWPWEGAIILYRYIGIKLIIAYGLNKKLLQKW